jgi:hypothetical protein
VRQADFPSRLCPVFVRAARIQNFNRLATIFFIGLLLAACTADPPEGRLQDYETRLYRTLSIDMIDTPTPEYPRFPGQRDMRMDSPREEVGILDLWSMRECALHGVVAQRNSSLGRVAQPSTRMFYELDFLRLAPACIDLLVQAGTQDLATTLSEVRSRKEERLPEVIWRGVLGGVEYQRYWKMPQRLGSYPSAEHFASDLALNALASDVQRWLGKDYRFEVAKVETNLQILATGDGGSIYKSAVLQARYLARIDTAIEQRLKAGPVCKSAQDKTAPILNTVVRKYFVGVIQPWSVRLQSRAYKLDAAREIENLLIGGQPQAFAVWREDRDRLIAKALHAPRNHVEALLPVMRQCGLAPNEQAIP